MRSTTGLIVSSVLAIVAALTLGAPAEGNAQKRELFDEITERGRPIESTLKTMSAGFVERSTSALLETPLVARGTVAIERPSRIVLRYREPEQRTVLIDGDRLLVTWPARGIRQQKDIGAAQKRVQQSFIGKSSEQLRRHFDIAARIADDRVAWHVDMKPKRKQIQQGVTRIELWIDQQTVLPTAMKLTFPNGDTKLMEFSDVRVNPPLPAGTFDRDR